MKHSKKILIFAALTMMLSSCTITFGTPSVTSKSENSVEIGNNDPRIELSANSDYVFVGESLTLTTSFIDFGDIDNSYISPTYEIILGNDFATINGNILEGIAVGEVQVISRYEGLTSNVLVINVIPKDEPIGDPYENVNKTEFYANYQPAKTYIDSYYRSLHFLMSGSIEDQDQRPSISNYQPMRDNMYVRNTSSYYTDDGNGYVIVDAYGHEVSKVFKGGAYVTLEEVAAYVLAFSDVPVNYSEDTKTSPEDSEWGVFLRLNHNRFTGNTNSYPYEPALPNIYGIGSGTYNYYEIDIGTTGTDCDPKYDARVYNDGYRITRGAARIVYSRFERGSLAINNDEKHVFYTYNHYNDFQEYLNYYGGWGEMFGNITGGGTLSSKTDYNPTSYVETYKEPF